MSTLTRSVSSGLLLIALALGTWMVWDASEAPPKTPPVRELTQEATRGTAEDPDARRTYELRRLRDPETGTIPENARKKELAFAERMPRRLRKSGANSWQRRGPTNVGGRSRALGIDVSDPNRETLLAGGVSGGMWRTTDGGSSWIRTFDPEQRPSVTAVAQDPRSGRQDVWFAGTGEQTVGVASSLLDDRDAAALDTLGTRTFVVRHAGDRPEFGDRSEDEKPPAWTIQSIE